MPLTRNLQGFIYINYNSCTTTFTDVNGTWNATTNYGRCNPALMCVATTANSVSLSVDISGIQSSNLTSASAPINYARLIAPYYIANPSVDAALSIKKTFRYLERNVSQFTLTTGQSTTVTLSPGIANPKCVVLFPMLTNIGGLSYNPLLSPWDTVPGTTGPLAALKDLQVMVGGKPCFNSPIQMDYDAFIQEETQNGLEGGLVSQSSSGLLSQELWDNLHRFYTVDIGRRMESDDGSSKSIILQCTNPTKFTMNVIALVYYEKQVILDTAMCKLQIGN